MNALLGALKDRDLEVKKAAASAVGALGPAASKALPALRENLKDSDCSLRVLSAKALIAIDPAFSKNPAAVRAEKSVCPGEVTNPPLAPKLPLAEKAMGTSR